MLLPWSAARHGIISVQLTFSETATNRKNSPVTDESGLGEEEPSSTLLSNWARDHFPGLR